MLNSMRTRVVLNLNLEKTGLPDREYYLQYLHVNNGMKMEKGKNELSNLLSITTHWALDKTPYKYY